MGEQEPGVDQVERPAVEGPRVGDVIFDVAHTGVLGVLAGQFQDLRIEVDPCHRSVWADDAGDVQYDVAAAAAQIQAPVDAAQSGLGQQSQRSGLHDLREQVQPPLALFATGDRVRPLRWIHAGSHGAAPFCAWDRGFTPSHRRRR